MLHRWRYECYSQNLIVRDCELNVCVHMRAFVHAYVCAFDRARVCACAFVRVHTSSRTSASLLRTSTGWACREGTLEGETGLSDWWTRSNTLCSSTRILTISFSGSQSVGREPMQGLVLCSWGSCGIPDQEAMDKYWMIKVHRHSLNLKRFTKVLWKSCVCKQ